MSDSSYHEFRDSVISLLNDYCENYILFKPTHYLLVTKYINKINRMDIDAGDSDKLIELILMCFSLYKKLIERKSEMLATRIGLLLAGQLSINNTEYMRYRESKIWTQRYMQGFGPFECRVYKENNKNLFINELDPIYIAIARLKNNIELSKVVPANLVDKSA